MRSVVLVAGWLVYVGLDLLVQAPRIEGKQIILMSHCRSIIISLLLLLHLLFPLRLLICSFVVGSFSRQNKLVSCALGDTL